MTGEIFYFNGISEKFCDYRRGRKHFYCYHKKKFTVPSIVRKPTIQVSPKFLIFICIHFHFRQENERLHMELDRMRDMPPPPRFGGLQDGLRDRSRSPEPGYGLSRPQSVDPRIHVEVAELKDKLEQTQNELRRTQAELRLNQGDYERSHVELESMQEKVRKN